MFYDRTSKHELRGEIATFSVTIEKQSKTFKDCLDLLYPRSIWHHKVVTGVDVTYGTGSLHWDSDGICLCCGMPHYKITKCDADPQWLHEAEIYANLLDMYSAKFCQQKKFLKILDPGERLTAATAAAMVKARQMTDKACDKSVIQRDLLKDSYADLGKHHFAVYDGPYLYGTKREAFDYPSGGMSAQFLDKMNKLSSSHITPMQLQGPRCYSNDTWILTTNGFKPIALIGYDDELATLNPQTLGLEYWRPNDVIHQQYSGDMVHVVSKTVDMLVTPNHRMFARRKYREFGFIEASSLVGEPYFEVKRDAEWVGIHPETIDIPLANVSKFASTTIQIASFPAQRFMEFMGWYLAEGCTYNSEDGDYRVVVSNYSDSNKQAIYDVVKGLGFNPCIGKRKVEFASKQMVQYLEPLGHSKEKHIPKNLKEMGPSLLRVMLASIVKGDGSVELRADGGVSRMCYNTSSWRLANDVMEIGLKCGYGVNIFPHISGFSGSEVKYRVTFSHHHLTPKIHAALQHHSGTVHCVNVRNHLVFVMRNGKTAWSGNSWGANGLAKFTNNKDIAEFQERVFNLNKKAPDMLVPEGFLIVKIMDPRDGDLIKNHIMIDNILTEPKVNSDAKFKTVDIGAYIRQGSTTFQNEHHFQNLHGYWMIYQLKPEYVYEVN